ncbi:MAG: hypothetical protein ABIP94_22510 [Planctomycetota bacterium]
MNVRELALFGLFLGVLTMLVTWVVSWAKRRHQMQKQRLDVLQQALQHSALDAATRAELLRVLVHEHEGAWSLVRIVRAIWFGGGWTMFIVAGGMLAASAARMVRGVDMNIVLPLALVGFAMVSLPVAWNELKFRRQAQPTSN